MGRPPPPAASPHPPKELGTNGGGPSSRDPPYIKYVTEPGDSCGKISPSLLTRCRPTVKHSLAAGDAQRQRLQACLPEAISRNARSLPDFPEFAQAVRNGVPGTTPTRSFTLPPGFSDSTLA